MSDTLVGVVDEGVNESADCDLTCSRGLQPAFGSWILLGLSAPKRGWSARDYIFEPSDLIHSHLLWPRFQSIRTVRNTLNLGGEYLNYENQY